MPQPFGIELLRQAVRVDQPTADARLLAGDVAALLVAELDARTGGEPLNRLAELEALDLHQELDDVAALATGEAVVELLARRHVERWGALLVERAQALEVAAACRPELQVLADDVRDG